MARQKILLCDDSEDIHVLVRLRLAAEPVDLVCTDGGVEALRLAVADPPDLILLDVDMPDPDGFEVCRRLKANPLTCEIPVIFLTGASSTEQKLTGLGLGAVDYVLKPFDPAELLARVKASLKTKQLLDSLQENEERFRFLAENSSDMISRHGPGGEFLYASPACRAILGYDPVELVGRPLWELASTDDLTAMSALFTERAAGGTDTATFRARRRDGRWVWMESTARTVLRREGAGATEVHLTSRDVTQRKRGESMERGRAEILQMIAESQPLDAVLQRLVAMAEQEYPTACAAALLLAEGRLEHTAPTLPPNFKAALDERLLPLAAHFAGDASSDPPSVVCSDIATDAAWAPVREEAARHGIHTCWLVPLRSSGGEVLGHFALYHRNPARPDADAVALLGTAAKLLTIAIEREMLTVQLAYRAQHDSLTGLPNRLLFDDRLGQALARARRNGYTVALLCMDLDRFKLINDTLGHHAGDLLLIEYARRVLSELRQTDTLARMGGDEFALILADQTDARGATATAEKLLESMKQPFNIAGHELFVTGSIGIAYYPTDAADATALQKNADLALYRAKALGRDRYHCFTPDMLTDTSERISLENALRRAVSANEFRLFYQPQVDATDRIAALESLVRWHHPTLGLLPPAKFIALSEETGLILHVGEWVLNEACRQCRAWLDAGYPPVPVAVNVSAIQLAQAGFVESVAAALTRHRLPPNLLEIELTESLLMVNARETGAKLQRLAEVGVHVALDDFGTGYSSLAYLQHLPIHKLKIDRSFVRQVGEAPRADAQDDPLGANNVNNANGNNMAVVRAVISMGKSLGMTVVAEGVETPVQRDLLREAGCQFLQGYLYGRPQPADELEPFLRQSRKAAA